MNLMGAALLRIGHIEMKIWVGQWLLFQEEGVENLVCHLVFACVFSPCFILLWFDAKYIVQIHVSTRTSTVACCMKRKKRNSCQADTSTHLFFVHLFAHALSPRRYSLHLGFFKDMEISYTEERFLHRGNLRRCIVSVKEKSPKRRLLPTFLQKVKLSKGQQRKNYLTILTQT